MWNRGNSDPAQRIVLSILCMPLFCICRNGLWLTHATFISYGTFTDISGDNHGSSAHLRLAHPLRLAFSLLSDYVVFPKTASSVIRHSVTFTAQDRHPSHPVDSYPLIRFGSYVSLPGANFLSSILYNKVCHAGRSVRTTRPHARPRSRVAAQIYLPHPTLNRDTPYTAFKLRL